MRRAFLGAALALALAGCSASPLTLPGLGGKASYAALQFRAMDASKAQAYSAAPESTSAAPMAAGAAMDARIAPAIMPGWGWGWGGGPFGNLTMEPPQEADAPGAAGDWAAVKAQVVDPLVADWAADAELVRVNGVLGADGKATAAAGPDDAEAPGWSATYASSARLQVLEIQVSPQKTHVVRLSWKRDPLGAEAAMPADRAVALAVAAVRDKAAKGSLDGVMYADGGTVGLAVPAVANGVARSAVAPAPATAPAVSAPNAGVGVSGSPGASASAFRPEPPETLYELPEKGRWYAGLQRQEGHLAWTLSYSVVAPVTDGVSISGAYVVVDAASGEILHLSRPMRYPLYVDGQPEPMPLKRPVDAPGAAE